MTDGATVRLRSVVFDCPDPLALAAFYADLLGGELHADDREWCTVSGNGSGPDLAFQLVDSYRAPDWPGGSPQQLHLDLTVTDLAAISRRAQSLGAVVLGDPVEEADCVYLVLADPAGHPFCLCEERTGAVGPRV